MKGSIAPLTAIGKANFAYPPPRSVFPLTAIGKANFAYPPPRFGLRISVI